MFQFTFGFWIVVILVLESINSVFINFIYSMHPVNSKFFMKSTVQEACFCLQLRQLLNIAKFNCRFVILYFWFYICIFIQIFFLACHGSYTAVNKLDLYFSDRNFSLFFLRFRSLCWRQIFHIFVYRRWLGDANGVSFFGCLAVSLSITSEVLCPKQIFLRCLLWNYWLGPTHLSKWKWIRTCLAKLLPTWKVLVDCSAVLD